jgi:hypothetical protein
MVMLFKELRIREGAEISGHGLLLSVIPRQSLGGTLKKHEIPRRVPSSGT